MPSCRTTYHQTPQGSDALSEHHKIVDKLDMFTSTQTTNCQYNNKLFRMHSDCKAPKYIQRAHTMISAVWLCKESVAAGGLAAHLPEAVCHPVVMLGSKLEVILHALSLQPGPYSLEPATRSAQPLDQPLS